MTPQYRHRIALLFAIVLCVAAAFALTRSDYDPRGKHSKPLGVTRQAILDKLSRVYPLQTVENKLTLYVVKLGDSIATSAIQGSADVPSMANVTAPYTKETAPVLATAGNLLSMAILDDGE